ncbi:hypothetical protein FRC04_007230 [Tulasnella sp. 424]|nr:hypothetical protein FRC04_007230 [Tulasnella sp. 424]KAG8959903.1 hypothetical protein FRC05_007216 [Tulasnella sp. 425]
MKFTDGLWLLKDGVKPAFGLTVTDVQTHDSGVDLRVATRPIRHRGDTLGGPLLFVNLNSPSEGIIGLKVKHFGGLAPQKADFELFPDVPPTPPNLSTSKNPTSTTITSGPLSAVVSTVPGQYGIDFVPTSDPKHILTFAGPKSQAVVNLPSKWAAMSASNAGVMATDVSANPAGVSLPEFLRYILIELNLAGGELIYGAGEGFGGVVKNGQAISVWNRDGGTSSEQQYKSVPFYLSSRGYGVFVNHPGEVELEVGSEKMSRVGISVVGEELEVFVIYGPTPKEVLRRYTQLTGRPGLPPLWTFGLWLSTSFLTDYDEKTVSGFLQGMRDRKCDVRVMHFDCFWMKQYEWCNFTFDPDMFPNPAEYLRSIKEKFGVRVCVWINSYISQGSSLFQEGLEGGYFIKRTNGDVWQWDQWQPGLAVVDFTNPAACKWYGDKLRALLDLGVDCFKTDFGERIPHANVKYFDGSDPYKMHNYYTQLYNKLVFNVLQERLGEHEAVLFARSATAGGQRFPVHWGGDCESTWEAMSETLRGNLSLTLSGFGFASHDIGGFEGHPPREIYMRWCAYGAFSSHTRLHGSASYRVPWNYDTENDTSASKALAKFIDAKHRLSPYIYAAAIEAHETGVPVQRHTMLEFPADRTTLHLDQQFMLGQSLLVAPVFTTDDRDTEYYVPAGKWTSFWDSSKVVQGPSWVKEKVAYDDLPVLVRENSLLLVGKSGLGKPDWDFNDGLEARVYELSEGASVEAVVPGGKSTEKAATLKAERKDGKVTVKVVNGSLKGWSATLFAQGSGSHLSTVTAGDDGASFTL